MPYYDPDKAPDPDAWLDETEAERIENAAAYHRMRGISVPDLATHAKIHALVETQLAEGEPDVVDALARLVSGGLDRHEAIHAIGYVLAQHLFRTVRYGQGTNAEYLSALKRLTVASWRKRR